MSKAISMVLVSGIFLVAIRVLSQCHLPHLPSRKNYQQEIYPVNSCDMISIQHQSMESSKVWMLLVKSGLVSSEFICCLTVLL